MRNWHEASGPGHTGRDLVHLLVQSAVDFAVVALDPEGRVISWNEGARCLQGYAADEIIGQHWSVFYPPHDATGGRPARDLRVAAERGRCEAEGWRRRKDGSCFWANVVITPLYDDGRRLVGFGTISRDLTERKRTEDRRRAVQDVTVDVLAHLRLVDVLGALLARVVHLLRADAGAVLLVEGDQLRTCASRGLADQVETGDGTQPWTAFATRVAAERQALLIDDVQHADGASARPEATGPRCLLGVPLLVGDRVLGILCLGARDRAPFGEEDLRFLQLLAHHAAPAVEHAYRYERAQRSEEHFRLLVERVQDYAIYLIDPDGRIASWNVGAARIKGYAAEEIIGRPYATFFTPEDRAAGRPERLLRQARLDGRVEDEGWRVRKDGSRFWADAVLTALYDADGHLRGYAKVTRDLTERRRVEEERERHAAELREVNAELEAFSYSVSHDLQAPLRAMRGFAEALLEDHTDALDAEGQEYARRIAEAAERMDRLVRDVLGYSRLSRADLRPRPVSLARIVGEVLRGLSVEVKDRRARVQVQEPLPEVIGHHAILVQVVSNLVTNALKFVAPNVRPSIQIWAERRVSTEQVWVRLWVADNGIGIAPRHTEQIFGVLERLHGSEVYPGTGIGLAVVRRAVERLGGRVGVESEPGHGSRFWLDLPASDRDRR